MTIEDGVEGIRFDGQTGIYGSEEIRLASRSEASERIVRRGRGTSLYAVFEEHPRREITVGIKDGKSRCSSRFEDLFNMSS